MTFHDKALVTTLVGAEFPIWDTSVSAARRVSYTTVKRAIVNLSLVTAAGTDQAGATSIESEELHIVGTVPAGAGTKFQVLSAGLEGTHKLIRNAGAGNVLNHYPPSGGRINSLSINEPIPIEPNTTAQFYSISTVNWITVP